MLVLQRNQVLLLAYNKFLLKCNISPPVDIFFQFFDFAGLLWNYFIGLGNLFGSKLKGVSLWIADFLLGFEFRKKVRLKRNILIKRFFYPNMSIFTFAFSCSFKDFCKADICFLRCFFWASESTSKALLFCISATSLSFCSFNEAKFDLLMPISSRKASFSFRACL